MVTDIKVLVSNFELKLQQQDSEIKALQAELELEKKQRINLEAYSRRVNLLLLNVPEDIQNEREYVINTLNKNSQIVSQNDVDQIHRLGRQKPQFVAPRPVIIRFTSVRARKLRC